MASRPRRVRRPTTISMLCRAADTPTVASPYRTASPSSTASMSAAPTARTASDVTSATSSALTTARSRSPRRSVTTSATATPVARHTKVRCSLPTRERRCSLPSTPTSSSTTHSIYMVRHASWGLTSPMSATPSCRRSTSATSRLSARSTSAAPAHRPRSTISSSMGARTSAPSTWAVSRVRSSRAWTSPRTPNWSRSLPPTPH